MAQLPNVFKPDSVEDSSFAPLEAGWYVAKIVKSEMKKTKAGTGQYLSLSFKVCGGKYNGRMVFTNLNLINPNDTAVRIAESDLKKICEAAGHQGDLEDSADIHGIEIGVKLSLKPESAQWPAGNEIKDYKDASEVEVEESEGDSESPFEGFEE